MTDSAEDERSEGSITSWLLSLETRDERAAEEIWRRFHARVTALARRRLGGRSAGLTDEDDVALSAFGALFRGVHEGRFARLDDRQDLWQILAMITARKCFDALRREARRREERLEDEPMRPSPGPVALPEDLDVSDADFMTALSSTSAEFLGDLEPKLRQVARLRLEGRDNAEIAGIIGRSLATVERYLRMIRLRWQDRLGAA